MRARSLLAIALVVLPAAADAQRIPMRIRDRGPARPAPLPPAPGRVVREMRYVQLPYTVESYPFASYFNAPGLGSRLDNFAAGGFGERLDLRLMRQLSLTLDMTQTFIGGPAVAQTAELGFRFRPESEIARKWYPFFDVRSAAMYIEERNSRAFDYVDPTTASRFGQASFGFGGAVGTGVEYAITPRFTLTTTGALMRANLRPVVNTTREVGNATMTAVRYSIGFRFNPGRWTTLPDAMPLQLGQ